MSILTLTEDQIKHYLTGQSLPLRAPIPRCSRR